MAQIIFTIPDNKIGRIIAAMEGLYSIPTHIVPGEPSVIPGEPDEPDEIVPDFTPAQWAKESVRRWIIKQVMRFEKREAIGAIDIQLEDDIVS